MIEYFNRNEDRSLHVSVLAAVEVRSAVRRRQFLGDTDDAAANLAIDILVHETQRIVGHSVTAPIVAEAASLIDRHRLRALDAFQLASAIVCRSSLTKGDDLLFVASDKRLLAAAALEGFATWDPSLVSKP